MKIYKLDVDSTVFYPIEDGADYFDRTKSLPPYYKKDGAKYFAVCPACNNPIRIKALHGRRDGSPLPYGRHSEESVGNLAVFRPEQYDNCPLASKNKDPFEISERKKALDDIAIKVLFTIRDHFDRICLVLGEAMQFVVTVNFAESLLNEYFTREGYMYRYSSLINTPWMIALLSGSQNLFGRIIKDEELRDKITKQFPEARFNRDKLTWESGTLKIRMRFNRHRVVQADKNIKESVELIVDGGYTNKLEKEVYKKEIVFDFATFNQYLNIPEGKGVRDERFLDIAAKYVQPLLKSQGG